MARYCTTIDSTKSPEEPSLDPLLALVFRRIGARAAEGLRKAMEP